MLLTRAKSVHVRHLDLVERDTVSLDTVDGKVGDRQELCYRLPIAIQRGCRNHAVEEPFDPIADVQRHRRLADGNRLLVVVRVLKGTRWSGEYVAVNMSLILMQARSGRRRTPDARSGSPDDSTAPP